MDALLRRRAMMAAGGIEPPAPIIIPYIRGGADGSYIDTGITADSTTKVIIYARNVNPGCVFFFGSRVAYQDAAFGLVADGGYNFGRIRIDYGSSVYNVDDQWTNMSSYHKYELYDGTLKIDDSIVGTATASSFSNSQSIHLFGINNNGSHSNPSFPIDICACKIYKNGALVRDMTAVDSPSVGLYDAVSDTVFTNAGSGSFTYGSFSQNAYTPLEYITDGGGSYFDSGVYGTYGMTIVCKFRPTNSTAKYTNLLGVRITSPASTCAIGLGSNTSGQDNTKMYWRFGASDTSGQCYSGSSSSKLTNEDVVVVKTNATATVYKNNSQIGTNQKSSISTSFTTSQTIAIGTYKLGASSFDNGCFEGRIYSVVLGSERCYVPAKVNNVAGMYDTYNDVFYASDTSTDFTAGPTI